ncbi:MAG: sigma-54 dependent transcriptional regulator [Planctomycetota bacterium]|nr:sigma-54 dependent transcriptional regulator [Planctomycetota bacterium]
MTENKPRILVVDDEDSICRLVSHIITRRMDCYCDTYTDPEKALREFRCGYYNAALLDVRMPRLSGLELLPKLKEIDPDLPVVVLTAFGQWDTAVNAMRVGAFNFINKPLEDNKQLTKALEHAVRQHQIETEMRDIDPANKIHMIGKSPQIRRVMELVEKVGPTESTVLISGESGTGKELVARAIHMNSARRHGPFVAVNCGAFPDNLLESELFGHVKGAFTSAVADKIGMFEVANGGTFFLDEVAETSAMIQVKLLRVLETREIRPVGSIESRKFDVRIVAATNRDLEQEVNDDRFRYDLYYRLNVIPIHLPPLRERKEDIPLLVGHFLSRIGKRVGKEVSASNISPKAWDLIEEYPWPGNIRELENVIHRAFTLMSGEQITPEDLGLNSRHLERASTDRMVPKSAEKTSGIGETFDLTDHLKDIEISYIKEAMAETDGNMTEAAKLLGLTFRTFRYKVRKYRLK